MWAFRYGLVGGVTGNCQRRCVPDPYTVSRRRPFHLNPRCHAAGDHYDTLGVPRTASQDQIRNAFYKLSKEYHPDRNPASAEKYKDISAAYNVLSNPEGRWKYDREIGSRGVTSGPVSGYAQSRRPNHRPRSEHYRDERVRGFESHLRQEAYERQRRDAFMREGGERVEYYRQTYKRDRHGNYYREWEYSDGHRKVSGYDYHNPHRTFSILRVFLFSFFITLFCILLIPPRPPPPYYLKPEDETVVKQDDFIKKYYEGRESLEKPPPST